MPSIETLYPQQKDTIGNMEEKRKDGVDLILSDTGKGGSQSVSNHVDTDVIEAIEEKTEKPMEGPQTEGSGYGTDGSPSGTDGGGPGTDKGKSATERGANRTSGEGEIDSQNDLVILKIEEIETEERSPQEAGHDGENDQQQKLEDGGTPEERKGQTQDVPRDPPSEGSHDKKIEKICPGFSSSRSMKLKAKLSEVLGKMAPGVMATIPPKEADPGTDLSDRFDELALTDGATDQEEPLRAKGPVMRGGMGVSDLPGGYSPSYGQSPGQWSPQHDSTTSFNTIGIDVMGKQPGSGLIGYHWPQSNGSYYPVSPPETTYQQMRVSMSDMESIHSPQSPPDDSLQDIPTVMAAAMEVILPGQLEPGNQQGPLNGYSSQPPMVPSPHSGEYSAWGGPPSVPSPHPGDGSSREYQEESWPEMSPPSSLQGNPPSVGSACEVDSVFSYNPAMSPAGSTGSMVNSPAAPSPGYPQTVGSPHQYNITSSTNIGFVQVNRSSTSSCPSPPQESAEVGIQKLVNEIHEVEKNLQKSQPKPPSPSMPEQAPTPSPYVGGQHSPSQLQPYGQQPQNSIPSIDTLLPPNYGSTGASRRNVRITPYPPRSQAPACMVDRHPPAPYSMVGMSEQPCVTVSELPQYTPRVGTTIPVKSGTDVHAMAHHHQWANGLTAEQLLERDTNDPYEGENMVQKLILNSLVEQSIAVVHRMAQLGLDLNATNKQGQSALLLAVINNMPHVVVALVQNHADVQRGDNKGTYPVHYAASHGFLEVIQALVCMCPGAYLNELDFKGKTPLMCAVQAHGTEQRFYDNGEEVIRLVDNRQMAESLIKLGAQPTVQDASSGKTALHYAISEVKMDMISIILENDHSLQVAKVAMSDGNTPLHLAASLKCDQTAPWGQQRSCDQQTKCTIIQWLIHKGADISATNVERNKAIDYVTVGHTQVKECLERFSKSNKKR